MANRKAISAMCLLLVIFGLTWSTSTRVPTEVRSFVLVDKTRFPKAVLERDFCRNGKPAECLRTFRASGKVWAADINGDGVDELVVFPGTLYGGTLGWWYYLYQKRGTDWLSLVEIHEEEEDGPDGWQTMRPRFDILPTVRNGYHDLRITVDQCVKWNGEKYVEYSPEDYHKVSPKWFNASDSHEAEIFWACRYAGQETFTFEAQWFPVSPHEFLQRKMLFSGPPADFPPMASVVLNDREQNLKWVGLDRGGVWGLRGERGFLLSPQLDFLGARALKIEGDWLLVFESVDAEGAPSLRYNRRTHELRIHPDQ